MFQHELIQLVHTVEALDLLKCTNKDDTKIRVEQNGIQAENSNETPFSLLKHNLNSNHSQLEHISNEMNRNSNRTKTNAKLINID